MAHISILYAVENKSFADLLDRALTDHGYVTSRREVEQDECRVSGFSETEPQAVIVIWSDRSIHSSAIISQARAALARRMLTTISIGKVEPPQSFQHLWSINLGDWSGSLEDSRWRFVVDELNLCVRRSEIGYDDLSHRQPPDLEAGLFRSERKFSWPSGRSMIIAALLAITALEIGVVWLSPHLWQGKDEETQIARSLQGTHLLPGRDRTSARSETTARQLVIDDGLEDEALVAFEPDDPSLAVREEIAGVVDGSPDTVMEVTLDEENIAADEQPSLGSDATIADDAVANVLVMTHEEIQPTDDIGAHTEALADAQSVETDFADIEGAENTQTDIIAEAADPETSSLLLEKQGQSSRITAVSNDPLPSQGINADDEATLQASTDGDAVNSITSAPSVSAAAPEEPEADVLVTYQGQAGAQGEEAVDLFADAASTPLEMASLEIPTSAVSADDMVSKVQDDDSGSMETALSVLDDAGSPGVVSALEVQGDTDVDPAALTDRAQAEDKTLNPLAQAHDSGQPHQTAVYTGAETSTDTSVPVSGEAALLASLQEVIAEEQSASTGPSLGGSAFTERYFRECVECPDMVEIPAGSFVMGTPYAERVRSKDELTPREIHISHRYALSAKEVTFAQWDRCVDEGGCRGHRASDPGWGRGDRPVINVSYEDALAYARWLSAKTGHHYRLPTEAEWEYAARAGQTSPFSFGNAVHADRANFNGNYEFGAGKSAYRRQTVAVGSFQPNAFGLYDMHGNVWEWTEDCWMTDHAPPQAPCASRVLKGGAWNSGGWRLRAGHRVAGGENAREFDNGFRVARVITPDE